MEVQPQLRPILEAFRSFDIEGEGFIEEQHLLRLFARLDGFWKEDGRAAKVLQGAGVTCGQRVDYARLLCWLGETEGKSRALVLPVKQRGEDERNRFLEERWSPFLNGLQQVLEETRSRRKRQFLLHEVMPSHETLAKLAKKNLALTEMWHGRGNISALYEVFMEAAELDGHSPYFFSDIPRERSSDGYTRVLDMQARKRLYSGQMPDQSEEDSKVGSTSQSAGESPIDNLVLPNVLRRRTALLLFAGHRVQQLFLRMLQWKQQRLLASWNLLGKSEGAISARARLELQAASPDESSALRCLAELGRIVESYGQLPTSVRARISSVLAGLLGQPDRADDEVPTELQEFVEHCEKHPGRSFKGSRTQHKLFLLRAIACPALRIAWRSKLEHFTQHRYITVQWMRQVPLLALPTHAAAALAKPNSPGGDLIDLAVLRKPGAVEQTRFRKNIFAYGEAHGLGQGGGGCAEQTEWSPNTLMYEFGLQLCVDESAKVPNHGVTDIEKIVRDCCILCPVGGLDGALPGETLYDSGQNPIVASSIGLTQHTQTMRASAEDFPLLLERSAPVWHGELHAWIDLVQVGKSEDAFFISGRSRSPEAQPFLQFFVDLRVRFLQVFESAIDFAVICHPTPCGEFILIFAPVSCIQVIKVPKGQGCMGGERDYENPDLNELVTQHKLLPVACVDCSHGKGNVLTYSADLWKLGLQGRPVLTELYDFNRKPGSRAVAEAFLVASRSADS